MKTIKFTDSEIEFLQEAWDNWSMDRDDSEWEGIEAAISTISDKLAGRPTKDPRYSKLYFGVLNHNEEFFGIKYNGLLIPVSDDPEMAVDYSPELFYEALEDAKLSAAESMEGVFETGDELTREECIERLSAIGCVHSTELEDEFIKWEAYEGVSK